MPAFGRMLSLEECVKLAIEKNSALKSSEAAVTAAGEDVNIARSTLFPSLKLKGYYSIADKSDQLNIEANAFAPGIPPQNSSLSTGEKDSYAVALSLRQQLFAGAGLINAYRRAEHESVAASYANSRQRALLELQVKMIFNEALITANREMAAEKGIRAAEERLRVVAARFEEGYSDREELLRREADLALIKYRLVKSRNRSHLLMSKLKQLIGFAPDMEIAVTGKPVILALTADLGDLIQGVNSRRDDIKSATAKIAGADAGVEIARSGYFPQLFLEGNYLRQNATSLTHDELWTVKLQAEWSLFEWGKTVSEVRKAVAQRSQLDFAKEELSRSIRPEIEEAWREVAELQSEVAAQEKVMKADEAAFIKSIDKHLEGAARYDDVISGEAVLWETYDKYCQTAASLNKAFATLETAASIVLNHWTTTEELYRPQFEAYSKRIRERSSTAPKQQSGVLSKDEKISFHGATGGEPGNAAEASPPFQKKSNIATALKTGKSFCLQLGAYKHRKGAEEIVSSLAAQFSGKNFRVISERELFKPIVGPYSGVAEAKKAAESLGLKKYMIRENYEQ